LIQLRNNNIDFTRISETFSSVLTPSTGTNVWFVWFRGIELNATFSYISVISWRSVLSVEETLVHGETHRSVASH